MISPSHDDYRVLSLDILYQGRQHADAHRLREAEGRLTASLIKVVPSTVSISQVGLGTIDGLHNQGTFEGNRVSTGTLGNRPNGMSCLWRLPLPAH